MTRKQTSRGESTCFLETVGCVALGRRVAVNLFRVFRGSSRLIAGTGRARMRSACRQASLRSLLVLVVGVVVALDGSRADDIASRVRPADTRPQHEDAALAELGIHRYESQCLVLYSDIDPDIARRLPPLIDAVYPAWVDYFGDLPPAEDGSEFQLTGYLMADRGLFLDTGLLPEELVDFRHGKHNGYRFWMAEQQYDYYRRHLLIHEATHCFMMIEPARTQAPLFYLEGIAELFGAHRVEEDGTIRFRVMPSDPNRAVGFGRVEMIRRAVERGEAKSFREVLSLSARAFTFSRSDPYAWSWAVCKFLDTHPHYRERFRELASIRDGDEFRSRFAELFEPDRARLSVEWELFTGALEYGYDIERAAIDWQAGTPLGADESRTLPLASHRGWQSTCVRVSAGSEYRIQAAGEVTLADEPKPWVSQPQGVTIRYSGGRPIGRVTGIVLPNVGAKNNDEAEADLGTVIDSGRETIFEADRDGVLYLRVNDFWSSLENNRGSYDVTVETAE